MSLLRTVFSRGRAESEMAEELRFHLEQRVDHLMQSGMTRGDAERHARIEFGGVENYKEECREALGIRILDELRADVRFALRNMGKARGTTAIALACLALGIGANTAIFSVMNAVMLRYLPVKDPGRLIELSYNATGDTAPELRHGSSGYDHDSLSYPTFEYLQEHTTVLSDVFGFVPLGFNKESLSIGFAGELSPATGEMVTGGYFAGLGVKTLLGRTLNEDDARPGRPAVAVLSYGYWSRQFGRDASIVGRTVAMNRVPVTVVGIARREFTGLNPALPCEVWLPLREGGGFTPWGLAVKSGDSPMRDRKWWWLMIFGRLRPGVSLEKARAALDVDFGNAITAGLTRKPAPDKMLHAMVDSVSRGRNNLRETYSKPLLILMIMAGLVLMIACANVATLLLARANARKKEMSVRLATGASRSRLIRQLLTESSMLSFTGGGLGLGLAFVGSRLLVEALGTSLSTGLDVQPDATVLWFSAGISIATGVLFGLAPAIRATAVDIHPTLKENATTISGRFLTGKVLVALQVGLSLVLLIGAGLFIRTLQNMEKENFGFDQKNLLVFSLDPKRLGYDDARVEPTFERVRSALGAIPEVRSVSNSQNALLTGWVNANDATTDATQAAPADSFVYWNGVGPRFFETMGINIILGRGIDRTDIAGKRKVAVINQTFAKNFFGATSPIGHRFNLGSLFNPAEASEIVGVAKDAKYDRVRREATSTAYLAYAGSGPPGTMYFEVRTVGDPYAVLPDVRRAIANIDPTLPMFNVKAETDLVAESLVSERMFARLSSFFGAVALLLVSIGLYGTLAYTVSRRTSEIGIRMALGARGSEVLWLILRDCLMVVGVGTAVGLVTAVLVTRYIEAELYGVKGTDAITLAASVVILASVTCIGGFIPARRAARIEPVSALRYE